MLDHVMYKVINCKVCPNCGGGRTYGAGYAYDFYCKSVPDPKADYGFKVIARYCEWKKEEPQDHEIPDWCPLRSDKIEYEKLQREKDNGIGI